MKRVDSHTLDITTKASSASIDLFGLYALMGSAPPPIISSITPAFGNNTETTSVVIAGDNFQPGAQVRLGDVMTWTATYINEQTLLVSIPASLLPGTYNVTVINPDGQEATPPGTFTVNPGNTNSHKIYLPILLR